MKETTPIFENLLETLAAIAEWKVPTVEIIPIASQTEFATAGSDDSVGGAGS